MTNMVYFYNQEKFEVMNEGNQKIVFASLQFCDPF